MTETMDAMASTSLPVSASLPPPAVSLPIQERLRNNNFDALRLIFASMVVVFHCALLSQADQLAWMTRYISSTFAVQAFFVVSGFLVTMSFENTKSIVDYGKKRLFRIAPAYIIVILIAAISLVEMSNLSTTLYFTDPEWRSYVISNLMMSNFNQPTLPGVFSDNFEQAVNGSLWTIKLEVMFYCAVPLLVWAIRRFGYRPVLALIFVLSVSWHVSFLYLSEAYNSDLAARLAKQIPGQLAFFGGGAFAYYRTRDGLSPPSFLVAVLGIAGYCLTSGLLHTIVAPFAASLIVYSAAIRIPQLWSAHGFGDFSYGLYLYHFPIAQTLIALGVFNMSPIVGLFVTFLLSLLAAIISWHFIEKHALKLVHWRTRASEKR